MGVYRQMKEYLGLVDPALPDERDEDARYGDSLRESRADHERHDDRDGYSPRERESYGDRAYRDRADYRRDEEHERRSSHDYDDRGSYEYGTHRTYEFGGEQGRRDRAERADRSLGGSGLSRPVGEHSGVHLSHALNPTLVPLSIESFDDVVRIGDAIKDGSAVVYDTSSLSYQDARRVVDFCAGLALGLELSLERTGERAFCLSPKTMVLSEEDVHRALERLA